MQQPSGTFEYALPRRGRLGSTAFSYSMCYSVGKEAAAAVAANMLLGGASPSSWTLHQHVAAWPGQPPTRLYKKFCAPVCSYCFACPSNIICILPPESSVNKYPFPAQGSALLLELMGLQDYTELLDAEGEDDEEENDEMLPAEVKIRPETGVLDPGELRKLWKQVQIDEKQALLAQLLAPWSFHKDSTAGMHACMHARMQCFNFGIAYLKGQETEVKIRFTPRVTGPITVYGVCSLVGAPLPCGFSVSSLDVMDKLLTPDTLPLQTSSVVRKQTCKFACLHPLSCCSVTRGLDVMYELLTQDQLSTWAAARAKPKAFKRRDDVDHFVGMSE
eukprot:1149920-Pelagomonas_calceolata.AAC.3